MATPESPVARRINQWKALFSVFLQDGLAYRAQGLIWILTDVSVAITLPLVWIAAAKGGTIQGFAAGDFVLYIPVRGDAGPVRSEPLPVGRRYVPRLPCDVASGPAAVHRRGHVGLIELTLRQAASRLK